MIPRTPRIVRAAVYLAGVTASFALAQVVCGAAANQIRNYPSTLFLLVLVIAAVTGTLGSHMEEKYLWSGWFKNSDEEVWWIGRSRSSLLTSAAPAPLSLGLALGILSVLAF